MLTPPNKSCVTCHVSHVTCHMSRVTCHMSGVTCHMSHVRCHMPCHFFFLGQSGEAYWWRVCYQWGLSRLVFQGNGLSLQGKDSLTSEILNASITINSVLDELSDMCQFCILNIHCFITDFLLHFCVLF